MDLKRTCNFFYFTIIIAVVHTQYKRISYFPADDDEVYDQ